MRVFLKLIANVLLLSGLAFGQNVRMTLAGAPADAGATSAVVTHTSASGAAGSAQTVTTGAISGTGATAIVIGVASYGESESSVGDSLGTNSYTLAGSRATNDTANLALYYICGPNVSGSMTFHATGGYPTIYVATISGPSASVCFDQFSKKTTCTGSSNCQVTSITPSVNNAIIITATSANTVTTSSIDGGFTITDQVNNGGLESGAMAYLVQTTATASAPTWSMGSTTYAVAQISLKP